MICFFYALLTRARKSQFSNDNIYENIAITIIIITLDKNIVII